MNGVQIEPRHTAGIHYTFSAPGTRPAPSRLSRAEQRRHGGLEQRGVDPRVAVPAVLAQHAVAVDYECQRQAPDAAISLEARLRAKAAGIAKTFITSRAFASSFALSTLTATISAPSARCWR